MFSKKKKLDALKETSSGVQTFEWWLPFHRQPLPLILKYKDCTKPSWRFCLLLLMRTEKVSFIKANPKGYVAAGCSNVNDKDMEIEICLASTCPPTAYGRRWLCKFKNFHPFAGKKMFLKLSTITKLFVLGSTQSFVHIVLKQNSASMAQLVKAAVQVFPQLQTWREMIPMSSCRKTSKIDLVIGKRYLQWIHKGWEKFGKLWSMHNCCSFGQKK